MYQYTHLEDYIKHFYMHLGITTPSRLSLQAIASHLDIRVFYCPNHSQALFFNTKPYIFLKKLQSPAKDWQDFCHELCHVLLHSGDQFRLPPLFQQYQEYKANNFMYHACVPSFMLEQMEVYDYTPQTVTHVQKQFNVEYEFAEKRLIQYTNKKLHSLYWNGNAIY